MIAIIDYGMGNLRSVQKALEAVGANVTVSDDPKTITNADQVVLPGVGAIAPAMERLETLGIIPAIKSVIAQKKPFLGICLGLQLLFENSDEGGNIPALGILSGGVKRFTGLKIPHMGWNQVSIKDRDCPLFQGIADGFHAYFCHSYYILPGASSVIGSQTLYGVNFASSIADKNIFGVQFHPEKSQKIGLHILKNFAQLK